MTTESNHPAAIILAAGKGTRMRSATAKVLHHVAGRPMLAHVMQAAREAGCETLCVVCAPDMPEVEACARRVDAQVRIAHQAQQCGTAHAVLSAREALQAHEGDVVVLFGDSPLITPATIRTMLSALHEDPALAVVVFGFYSDDPPAYGRLMMDENGQLTNIVEAKDATPEQLAVGWCNSGVMALRGGPLLWELLARIGDDNAQGEYYLTDIIAAARRAGYRCRVVEGDETEALGVNTRAQLAGVEARMQQRLRSSAMEAGVSMIAPDTVFLSADTSFGRDVSIEPHVVFGPGVTVGDAVQIRAFSHIEGATIGESASIGPFARLRPGSEIGPACRIGNFVELKMARLEAGAKVSHLSYIGDAKIGAQANIGAGTITCNYDGYRKHHTEIGARVFVGSNTALVAPVRIGAGAMIGAGSVITQDVAGNALSLARARQVDKEEWAVNFRKSAAGKPD